MQLKFYNCKSCVVQLLGWESGYRDMINVNACKTKTGCFSYDVYKCIKCKINKLTVLFLLSSVFPFSKQTQEELYINQIKACPLSLYLND